MATTGPSLPSCTTRDQETQGAKELLVEIPRVAPEADIESGFEEQHQCRICLESDGDDLIAPCRCRGSAKFVHRECLDQWRSTKEGAAFSQCTTCKARYCLSVHPPKIGARAAKFGLLFARDTFVFFLLTQLCTGLYALIASGFDYSANGSLRLACGFESPALFYYLYGLFIFLFVSGILGRQVSRAQRAEQHTLVLLTLRRRRRQRGARRMPHQGRSAAAATASAAAAGVGGSSSSQTFSQQLQDLPSAIADDQEALELLQSSCDEESPRMAEREGRGPAPEGGRALTCGAPPDVSNRLQRSPSVPMEAPSSSGTRFTLSPPDFGRSRSAEEPSQADSLSRSTSASSLVTLEDVEGGLLEGSGGSSSPEDAARPGLDLSSGERRVLLRFRHAADVSTEAFTAGGCVAFFLGILAIGMMVLGIAMGHLDWFFVACLAALSVPSGLFHLLKAVKHIWDSHRCVLTKRALTEEFVVADLSENKEPSPLPCDKEEELRSLGLW